MRLILVFFLMSYFSVFSFAQMKENLREEIQKIIFNDTEITFDKVPGYVIGIIVEDSVFVLPYGSVSKNVQKAPDENTIFELGGLSKVFTATLVEILADEGKLHYDSTLNSYLPPDFRNPQLDHLTIYDLVVHTTGLPKMPLEFGVKETETNNPYTHYTKKDLLEFYKDYFPDTEEKPQYYYSHVNYALLEIVIEKVCQKGFAEVLDEKIFQPLGMNNSGIAINEDKKANLATGYSLAGKATPVWEFQSFAASEGIKSTAADLLKFLSANLKQANPDFAKYLEPTHDKTVDTGLNKNAYGAKGWHGVKQKKYYDAIMHSGYTSGQKAYMGFVKETKTAVVMLSNSEYGMNGLGYLVLRLINNNWKKKKH